MDFGGPHYSPDLVGPDGRLTRLHKGGKQRANAQAAEANRLAQQRLQQQARQARQQANQARRARELAARTAAADRAAASRDAQSLAEAQRQLAEAMNQNQAEPAPTQYIEDTEAIQRARRGAGAMGAGFGISTSRALSQFGLGGGGSRLG